MSKSTTARDVPHLQLGQSNHVKGMVPGVRDRLVVFVSHASGSAQVESLYGDPVWWPVGATTNISRSRQKLDFTAVPVAFQTPMKAMVYRYLRRGCEDQRRPGAGSLAKFFNSSNSFLRYLHGLGISSLADVNPFICSAYLQQGLGIGTERNVDGHSQALPAPTTSSATQYRKLKAVEQIYALSKFTDSPMPSHPWPAKSAHKMSGIKRDNKKTPLMTDDVFEKVFQAAWSVVLDAGRMLDLRDELDELKQQTANLSHTHSAAKRNEILARRDFDGTCGTLNVSLNELRVACYVIVASLSGCRNHELANLRSECLHSTSDVEGNIYWWMRSVSSKTGAGECEWMVPEAAVTAIQALERWALPAQKLVQAELDALEGGSPKDKRVSHPAEHVNALFLGVDLGNKKRVRTWSLSAINVALKKFAVDSGVTWKLASHQFRRKFANYAARSQFGDLRYLKEHFQHWSMDMTLGYALNEDQEMALYLDIQDELDDLKQGAVERWLKPEEPLAGGYGIGLIDWRDKTDNIVLFKSRAAMVRAIASSTPIRSNGHSWCTAQDNLCVGNDVERTRCGDDCDHSVIERKHQPLYQGLYAHLLELDVIDDIGEGGKLRVQRDLARCRHVLNRLSPAALEAAST